MYQSVMGAIMAIQLQSSISKTCLPSSPIESPSIKLQGRQYIENITQDHISSNAPLRVSTAEKARKTHRGVFLVFIIFVPESIVRVESNC